jgi:hypothetical protein
VGTADLFVSNAAGPVHLLQQTQIADSSSQCRGPLAPAGACCSAYEAHTVYAVPLLPVDVFCQAGLQLLEVKQPTKLALIALNVIKLITQGSQLALGQLHLTSSRNSNNTACAYGNTTSRGASLAMKV